MRELRVRNPIVDEWVLLVPERRALVARVDMASEVRSQCPFCADGAEAVSSGGEIVASSIPWVSTGGSYPETGRYGYHEVAVYSELHTGKLYADDAAAATRLLEIVASRTEQMFGDDLIEEVVGDHFGPTIDHPHAQIVGLPFIPRSVAVNTAECHLCCSPGHEVLRAGGVIVTVPTAARMPFEVVVTTERHAGRLAALTVDEIHSMAAALHEILAAQVSLFGGMPPPYLMGIFQSSRDGNQHVRVEILPLHTPDGRLKRPSAMEMLFGVFTTHADPMESAAMLRAALHG